MEKNGANTTFQIECLDHVAIRVRDMEYSRKWYEKVLGLTSYQLDAWGTVPIFLLAGKTGIALFPADPEIDPPDPGSRHVKIDHYAFRLSQVEFEKAKKRYEELGIEFNFQDHTYFHSVYTRDPDGHTVELTTLVVPESSFYHI